MRAWAGQRRPRRPAGRQDSQPALATRSRVPEHSTAACAARPRPAAHSAWQLARRACASASAHGSAWRCRRSAAARSAASRLIKHAVVLILVLHLVLLHRRIVHQVWGEAGAAGGRARVRSREEEELGRRHERCGFVQAHACVTSKHAGPSCSQPAGRRAGNRQQRGDRICDCAVRTLLVVALGLCALHGLRRRRGRVVKVVGELGHPGGGAAARGGW